MNKHELSNLIKRKGLELGFSKVGITTADDFEDYAKEISRREDYDIWANSPRGAYLKKGAYPCDYFPEGKSIVCAVYSFAEYDYPEVMKAHVARAYLSRSYGPREGTRCGVLVNEFRSYLESLGCKIYSGDIDLPSRIACARAGIITFGKNNFAYTDEDGSFIILHTFLVDTELVYDNPTIVSKCPPNCRACIQACPTQAILEPGRLLPQRCILYNQMLKDTIPLEIRDQIGGSIHGCDICQNVCPRNHGVIERANKKDPFVEVLKDSFDLVKILELEDGYFEDIVQPIMYNYIRDKDLFRRNAAIALGNTGDEGHIYALEKLLNHSNPIVRDAAEWAIGKLRKNSDS